MPYGNVNLVETNESKYAVPAMVDLRVEVTPAVTPSTTVSIRSVLVLPVCVEMTTPSRSSRSDPALAPVAGPAVQSTRMVWAPAAMVTQAPVSVPPVERDMTALIWLSPAAVRWNCTAKIWAPVPLRAWKIVSTVLAVDPEVSVFALKPNDAW